MKNNTCEGVNFKFTQTFLPAVYILVFIIGLIANGWGLKSLLQNWKKLGNINMFVLNLGLTDILYLLTLPFLVVYYFLNEWIFGHVFCKITRFCFNVNLYGSIGFLTCISIYRYLAIVHPMRAKGRITAAHSVAVTIMVWVLVSIQSVPDMFFAKTFGNRSERCFDTTSRDDLEQYLQYSLGWTVTGFCIPILITLGCYGHVIFILCRKNTIDNVLKQRSLKLLFILIVLFSICYIPYHILKNLNLKVRVLTRQRVCHNWFNGVYIAHQISRGLVCLNSAINPLVNLQVNEKLYTRVRRLLRRSPQPQ
ncbi:P2Y purinoceptor 1 [Diretmus argenteus]